MKRRKKRMCKYANMDVVKVTTKEQLQIIKTVLSCNSTEKKADTQQPNFDSKLWPSEDKK